MVAPVSVGVRANILKLGLTRTISDWAVDLVSVILAFLTRWKDWFTRCPIV